MRTEFQKRQPWSCALVVCALAAWLSALPARAETATPSLLDLGYRQMYSLQFEPAHKTFQEFERQHPDDALGPVSDAAGYLFSEFNRLHILQVEFFADDHNFEGQQRLKADPQIKQAFEAQLDKATQLWQQALAQNPNDKNALFAKALTLGLHADYAALIEKRDLTGLRYVKQARVVAQQLLAADPSYYDAYVAVGVENYLLSLKPAPLRWALHLGGAQTDKATGLQDLQIAADKGHYLLPYARLLLAVAAVRDHDTARARLLLVGLAQEFPQNPLYARELARLQ
jgi:tetratricopeptide (TPR) repeat protein